MKILLLCLSVVLASIFSDHSNAHDILFAKNAEKIQQEAPSIQIYSQGCNLMFDANLLVEADDDINDNERKIIPFQKTTNKALFLADKDNSGKCFKRNRSNYYSFHLPTSLYIFHNVFRI